MSLTIIDPYHNESYYETHSIVVHAHATRPHATEGAAHAKRVHTKRDNFSHVLTPNRDQLWEVATPRTGPGPGAARGHNQYR